MNRRNVRSVLVVFLAGPDRDPGPSDLPAAAMIPPDDLARALRAANLLAWRRRRAELPFVQEFLSIAMRAPWAGSTVRRRRAGARRG